MLQTDSVVVRWQTAIVDDSWRHSLSRLMLAAMLACILCGFDFSIMNDTSASLSAAREAEALWKDAHYEEAEKKAAQAVRLSERLPPSVRQKIAPGALNLLALTQYRQGRLDEAESNFRRALAMVTSAHGEVPALAGHILTNLGKVYDQRGQDIEAERHHQQSLDILERTLSSDDPKWALALLHLGRVADQRGRLLEAADLLNRGIGILERIPEANPRALAAGHDILGGVYYELNELDLAQEQLNRAAAVTRAYLRSTDPILTTYYSHQGELSLAQGRLDHAEELFSRALEMELANSGPNQSKVELAFKYSNMGRLRLAQKHYEDAEVHLGRALAIMTEAIGLNHPDSAETIAYLAAVQLEQGNVNAALQHINQFAEIFRQHWRWTPRDRSLGVPQDHNRMRKTFLTMLKMLASIVDRRPFVETESLHAQAFEAIQMVTATQAAGALLRMSARLSAGSDALGKTIRERQDAVVRWRLLYDRLTATLARQKAQDEASPPTAWRSQLQKLDSKIERLDAEIAASFPQYAQLLNPAPVTLNHIRDLLTRDEALVVYAFGKEQGFVMLIRHDTATLRTLEIDAESLRDSVNRIRLAMRFPTNLSSSQADPYDTFAAYELYQRLFGPVEQLLEGVKHLIVVPDQALNSLPLGLLVTQQPETRPTSADAYRRVPWLFRDFAISVLPTVTSLRALRNRPPRASARLSFIGFGNPQLGAKGRNQTISVTETVDSKTISHPSVQGLPDLPQTEEELRAVAAALEASSASVVTGEHATETAVRRSPLDDFRVVMFATHGLTPRVRSWPPEAGLILTSPRQPSDFDDGFLGASEVAQLNLNANLVILSACSTAYRDELNTVGFSSLVSAFFFAGARAIIVSHWVVEAGSSAQLTATLAETLAGSPGMRAAEALRHAMATIISNRDNPQWAHPVFWAPFAIVGESPGGFQVRGKGPG